MKWENFIVGFIRCSKTYADEWSHITRVIRWWKSDDLKPIVSLSVSWVVMQGAAVAESSGAPTGEVAKGRSWGLQWDSGGDSQLLVSECDCFIGCDTTTEQLTKDWQCQPLPPCRYPRGIPHPNPDEIVSLTLVLPTVCPHLYLRAPGKIIAFKVTIARWASSLASAVYLW